jgi:hypothetical protein
MVLRGVIKKEKNMDMRKIILIASLFILQACATKLTQQGQQVRLVDKQSDSVLSG